MCDRIVALVDMDCFYCQVEARLNPTLQGKPMAVVQYNPWQGGGIIAVNYEAREFGVTRHVRGNEAKQKCPDIILVQVPEVRGKSDLTRYRDAGREVVEVLCEFSECVEKASVDEAYLDLTKAIEQRMLTMKGAPVTPAQLSNTFIVGFTADDTNNEEDRKAGVLSWLKNVYHNDLCDHMAEKLTIAGLIVEEMRAAIYSKTGFRCSAGIAHNKILGKLACGIHKPNRQTILPHSSVAKLYQTLPVKKVRSLGGKFGDAVVEQLGCKVMADLSRYTEYQLQQHFDEKTGSWLYNIARGFDLEPVTPRLMSKSIGCCKKFPGKQALATRETVEKWLLDLSTEVSERLLKELATNKRRATLLTVAYQQNVGSRTVSSSRCGPLTSYEPQQIAHDAIELIKKSNSAGAGDNFWSPPLKYLGLSVGKFLEKNAIQTSTMHSFFKSASRKSEVNQLEEKKPELSDVDDEKKKDIKEEPTISLDDLFKDSHNGEIQDTKVNISVLEKESFFVRYFKKEGMLGMPQNTGQVKTEESRSEKVIVCDPGPSSSNTVHNNEKRHGACEGIASTCNPSVSSQKPSTSGLKNHTNEDSNSNANWISLQEIFPDLNQVDEDVVALLPSPMQKQLLSRIEEHKENYDSVYSSDESDENMVCKRNHKIHTKCKSKCLINGKHNIENSGTKDIHRNKFKSSKIKKPSDASHHMLVNVASTFQNIASPVKLDKQEISLEDFQNHCNTPKGKTIPKKEVKVLNNSNITSSCENSSDNSNFMDDLILEQADNIEDSDSCNNFIPMKSRNTATKKSLFSEQQSKITESTMNASNYSEEAGSISPLNGSPNHKLQHCQDSNDGSSVKSEVCPQCQQLVPLQEYPEHLDFHVAKELDRQLNCFAPIVNRGIEANKSAAKDTTAKKRGRPSKKQQPAVSDKKIRSITNFFSPVK